MCGRKMMAPSNLGGRNVACPDCGTLIPVPKPKPPSLAAPRPAPTTQPPAPTATPVQEVQREKVVHIGVNCSRCGTRIHATDRQVGEIVPCPDCNCPVTIPPPKADAPVEEQIIGGAGEYSVSAPPQVVSLSVKSSRALPSEPRDDPDFDFLDEVEDPELRWRLRDRSDELGFLGHPGASKCWFGFCIGGVGVFAIAAVALLLFKTPESGEMTAVTSLAAFVVLAVAGLACLAWGALFSVNLLAIVQDTSAGNHIIRNWPEGSWSEQIGESFYVFNSCLVSAIPISILLQTCPPARPLAIYLYMAGFWLTLPVVLLSMLAAGSVLTPVSGQVMSSLLHRPGAWAWFYFRSFGLLALGLAMYIAFWRHICGLFGLGPMAMPLLVPMATALAMVYARWLGILGMSVREMMEEEEDDEEADGNAAEDEKA
jgi:DNA-directed RNA polymerase subunit RPC12/RpoP